MSEETNRTPETDEPTRAETRKHRVRFAILYSALLFVLIFLFLYVYGIYDYVCVCRIQPTSVVDSSIVWPYSPGLEKLVLSGKFPGRFLLYRHYVVPEGATEIAADAFASGGVNFCLRSVEIPGSVKKIGRGAFSECVNLTTLELPEGVETIDTYAFRKCANLKRVKLPASLKTIGPGAFAGCTSLEKIRIPPGVKEIGIGAFLGCSALADVELPPGVNVAPEAFSGTLVPPEKIPTPKPSQP